MWPNKKKSLNVVVLSRRWSEEKVLSPTRFSILQFRNLKSTLSKKVGKPLKIAGKLQDFAFKRY
jgi:hypothetical protein